MSLTLLLPGNQIWNGFPWQSTSSVLLSWNLFSFKIHCWQPAAFVTYLREEAIFNVNPRFAFKSMPAIGFLSFYFVANGHFESIWLCGGLEIMRHNRFRKTYYWHWRRCDGFCKDGCQLCWLVCLFNCGLHCSGKITALCQVGTCDSCLFAILR